MTSAAPGVENGWIHDVLATEDNAVLSREMATWPMDASAIGDERPFFFYQDRLRYFMPALFASGTELPFGNGLVILAKVLAVALVFVASFLLLPLSHTWRDLLGGEGAASRDLAYVSCLGVGFMFVEIGLVQRFTLYLGHPTYTLAVVLLVILIGGGLGSRSLSAVAGDARARRVARVLIGIVFYLFAVRPHRAAVVREHVAVAHRRTRRRRDGAPRPARLFIGGAFSGRDRRSGGAGAFTRKPWLWAMNSAMGVLGSVVATMASLHAGIDACLGAGAASYLCALLLASRVTKIDLVPAGS